MMDCHQEQVCSFNLVVAPRRYLLPRTVVAELKPFCVLLFGHPCLKAFLEVSPVWASKSNPVSASCWFCPSTFNLLYPFPSLPASTSSCWILKAHSVTRASHQSLCGLALGQSQVETKPFPGPPPLHPLLSHPAPAHGQVSETQSPGSVSQVSHQSPCPSLLLHCFPPAGESARWKSISAPGNVSAAAVPRFCMDFAAPAINILTRWRKPLGANTLLSLWGPVHMIVIWKSW